MIEGGDSALLETPDPLERVGRKPGVASWPVRIGIVLMITVLTVVVFEATLTALPSALIPAAFRTINTFYTRRAEWRLLTTSDAYLGFKLRPDVEVRFPFERGAIPIRTTSHGLEEIGFRDIGTRPPFGAIAIGDSFTFCDEVAAEDCWVRRLSDTSGVSIATLGVSGYSTLAEARVLKRYGPAFSTPLVLVGVFPNDLSDNVNFDEWSRSGTDFAVWLQRKRGTHPATLWLEEHSTMYRLLGAAMRAREREVRRYREGNLDLVLRFDDWWMEAVKGPDRHPGWPLMQAALLDMRQSAAALGAQLVVLIFPTKEEVYWDIARRFVPASEAVDIDRLPRLLNQFLAESGILACEPTPELRTEAQRGRQLYHRVSGHFNKEGNHVAARAIARCLAGQRLLDGTPRADLKAERRSAR